MKIGGQLYNAQGEPCENTKLMKEYGLNAARYRVWVDPRGGFSSKEDVLRLALRAKEQGMAIMIGPPSDERPLSGHLLLGS